MVFVLRPSSDLDSQASISPFAAVYELRNKEARRQSRQVM